MKGKITLPMAWGSRYEVFGGRYIDRQPGFLGVKMAVEINRPFDVEVPVADFSIPTKDQMMRGLRDTVKLILDGDPVYVGCMGGIGRTGLMLAFLAKAWGIANPVEYVRSQYYSHAVETDQQQKFIRDVEIPRDIIDAVRWAKFKNLFQFKQNLTWVPNNGR